MSDIRVSVQWKSSTVFAGEDIECAITFRNVARAQRAPSPNAQLRGHGFNRERWKDNVPSHSIRKSSGGHQRKTSVASQSAYRTHKPALSLNTLNGHLVPQQPSNSPLQQTSTQDKRRSISIVSIGGNVADGESGHGSPLNSSKKPTRGHSRAASLQVLPRRNGFSSPGSASGNAKLCTQPLHHSLTCRSSGWRSFIFESDAPAPKLYILQSRHQLVCYGSFQEYQQCSRWHLASHGLEEESIPRIELQVSTAANFG